MCTSLKPDWLRITIAAKKHRVLKKIEGHFVNDVLASLKRRLEISNSIDLLLNENAASPYVWGLFNYQIVVNPLLLSSENKDHVSAVLSHELMHIKGRDSVWLLISHFIKRLFFFNPISYVFYAKHRMAMEMAADENTIEQCGVDPSSLLNSILKIAESCTRPQDDLLQMNASQEFTEIKERISSMMNRPKKRTGWIYPTFSAVSLTLSLLITALQTNASVASRTVRAESVELFCSQVRHEMVIENWLRMEPQPNKCEMK